MTTNLSPPKLRPPDTTVLKKVRCRDVDFLRRVMSQRRIARRQFSVLGQSESWSRSLWHSVQVHIVLFECENAVERFESLITVHPILIRGATIMRIGDSEWGVGSCGIVDEYVNC